LASCVATSLGVHLINNLLVWNRIANVTTGYQ
jgi:hypothetical protein